MVCNDHCCTTAKVVVEEVLLYQYQQQQQQQRSSSSLLLFIRSISRWVLLLFLQLLLPLLLYNKRYDVVSVTAFRSSSTTIRSRSSRRTQQRHQQQQQQQQFHDLICATAMDDNTLSSSLSSSSIGTTTITTTFDRNKNKSWDNITTTNSYQQNHTFIVPNYLAQITNETVLFYNNNTNNNTNNSNNNTNPITIHNLIEMEPGEFVSTSPITIISQNNNNNNNHPANYTFRLNLYPFGTVTTQEQQSNKNKNKSGFGMSYKMEPLSKDIEWILSSVTKTILGPSKDNKKKNIMKKFHSCNTAIYLEYMDSSSVAAATSNVPLIDTSFTIRLIGNQISTTTTTRSQKFDLEWRAGMRYVGSQATSSSMNQDGTVTTDFGTNIMRSYLLPSFFGDNGSSTTNEPIRAQLDIRIHDPTSYYNNNSELFQDNDKKSTTISISVPPDNNIIKNNSPLQQFVPRDIRYGDNRYSIYHDIEQVRVGRVVVPICTKLSQRSRMFQLGIYPGVEYRIMRIHIPNKKSVTTQVSDDDDDDDNKNDNTVDVFYSQPGAYYDIKPIYPLVQQLERQWPVTVCEATDIPRLYTPVQYNTISAIGSLFTAISSLFVAYIISQCISIYYIPSRSMEPTLQVGDVLLVEKVTPVINHNYRTNDVVLFNPPKPLQDIVSKSGGTIDRRSLFVKRIAGTTGDRITVEPSGTVQITKSNGLEQIQYNRNLCDAEPIGLIKKFLPTKTQEIILQPNTVEVLGDCSSVSIDSRVWGELSTNNIVGRPIVRLWPLSKFGRIPNLPPIIE